MRNDVIDECVRVIQPYSPQLARKLEALKMRRPVLISDVIKATCDAHDVTADSLTSRERAKGELQQVRIASIIAAKHLTMRSNAAIGKVYGERSANHVGAIIVRGERLIVICDTMRERVQAIKEAIKV